MPRAEERKHVDGPEDRPFDVLVDQRLEVVKLALVERGMQRARKTPEAVLCHVLSPETGCCGQQAARKRVIGDEGRTCCIPIFEASNNRIAPKRNRFVAGRKFGNDFRSLVGWAKAADANASADVPTIPCNVGEWWARRCAPLPTLRAGAGPARDQLGGDVALEQLLHQLERIQDLVDPGDPPVAQRVEGG